MELSKLFSVALACISLLGITAKTYAQTTLAPGDVAIIALNSTDPDKFAVVLLRDIAANTVINFTDNGFDSPTAGRNTEGFLTYTAPSDQCAGTVLVWTNGMAIAGTGWSSNAPLSFAFNVGGDQLFAFQGSTANWTSQSGITLIYGVQVLGNFISTGTASSTTSYSPSSLAAAYKMVFPANNNVCLNATTLSGSASSILTSLTTITNYTQALNPLSVTFPAYTQFSVGGATVAYSAGAYCETDATLQTPTITGITGGSFSATGGLSINASTGEFTPSANSAGSYNINYSTSSVVSCPNQVTSVAVNITATPLASISYSGSPYCDNSSSVSPTFSGTTGGSYSSSSGLTVSASTGDITPSLSTAGTYTVTYNIAAGGCAAFSTTASVTITQLPSATISYSNASICSSGSVESVTLSGTSGGTFSSIVGLSINAVSGDIDPTTSTAGTYTVTYTIAAAGGCSAQTATTSVTISTAASATIAYSGSPYCSNASTVSPVLSGTLGGTYSSTAGLSISGATGVIDPSLSTAGNYTVSYDIAAVGGCAAFSTTANVVITQASTASISYSNSTFCSSGAVENVTLTGTSGGTFSSTSGLSVDANSGDIDPSTSSIGNYTVTYNIAPSGGCAAVSAIATVEITLAPSATIAYSGATFCTSGTVENVTISGTSGGTFSSTAGLSLDANSGDIDPSLSTTGNYTVTYDIAASGGCAAVSATATVDITTGASATISYSGSPYCSTSGTVPVVRVGSAGGTYSSTAGLQLGATSGAIQPSLSIGGDYTVTYTLPASNGCAAFTTTASVTIVQGPNASITYANSPFCSTAGLQAVTLTGTSGGTFSSTSGLTLDANTGEITPSTSTPGTYTVSYAMAAVGICSAQTTNTVVTIDAGASPPSISYAQSAYCTVVTSAPVAITGGTGGAFTANSADLSLNGTTGEVSPASSLVGSYTITYTVSGSAGCAAQTATAAMDINLTPVPSISESSSTTLCFGDSITLTSNYSTGNLWSDGSTSQAITVGVADTFTVTVTEAVGGCSATSSSSIIAINAPVDVNTTLDGAIISASAFGAGYLWLDCDNNFAQISGEFSRDYTAIQNGNYAVVVTQGFCSDTSACVNIFAVGMEDIASSSINLSQTLNGFLISSPAGLTNANLRIINLNGQLMLAKNNLQGKAVSVDFAAENAGLYIVEIADKGEMSRMKLVRN